MSSTDLLPKKSSDIVADLEYNKANNWPHLPTAAKRFLQVYSVAGDFRGACKEVGISAQKGARLLKDPLARGYLDHLMEDFRDEAIITRDFLELQLLETLEQVNGEVDIPKVTREGDVVMAKHFDAQAKIAVLKEMKSFAGIRDAGKGTGSVTVNFDFGAFGARPEEREVGITLEQAD